MKNVILLSVILLSYWSLFAQKEMQLVAHYPFNGNALDTSKYKNNGQVIGNVVPAANRFDQPNTAMQFAGNGYIAIPHNDALAQITDSLTITVWAKLTCINDFWFTILCKSDKEWEDRDSPHFRLQVSRNSAALCSEVMGTYVYNFLPDTWYFMAVSFSGKKLRFYVNGLQLIDTEINYKIMPNKYPLLIGVDPPGSKEYFCGILDDLRIYNKVLYPTEIASIMNDVDKANNVFFKYDTTVVKKTLRKQVVKTDTVVTVQHKTIVRTDTIRKQIVKNDTLVTIHRKTINKTDTLYRIVEKTDTIVRKYEKLDYSDLPSSFENKPVKYQNSVIVSSRDIQIIAFDDAQMDGDSISININGVWVKYNYPIVYKSRLVKSDVISMHLMSSADNYFITKAISEGTTSPCTLCLEISDGLKTQRIKLHCSKGYMAGIRIIYKKN